VSGVALVNGVGSGTCNGPVSSFGLSHVCSVVKSGHHAEHLLERRVHIGKFDAHQLSLVELLQVRAVALAEPVFAFFRPLPSRRMKRISRRARRRRRSRYAAANPLANSAASSM
jgi:hypothetical protein